MATSTKESKFLEEIDDNFLSCTICSERYKNAKILPCLHSFCEPCLGKLAEKSGVITCPICRRSHELPDTGVSGIDVNLFINELVEVFRKREECSAEARKCQGCRQAESVKHCLECGFDLCRICSGSHGVLPTSRSHRLMTLEEYQVAKSDDPAMLQPPVYCDSHVCNQIKFYCDTCDVSICLECTALDHPRPEHKYRYLKDATEEYSKDLKEEIDKVKVKENEASISKIVVMETIRSLDKCYQTEEKKMKGHIQKTIDDVTRMIREKGDTLLGELKDEYERRKINLNAQLKEMECVESDMSYAREYAEKLMHYGNAAQLMSAKKGIASQMEQLLNLETKTDPDETDYMEFQPCDDFYTTKSVGVLLVSTISDNCQLVDVPEFVRKDGDIIFTIATDIQRTKTVDENVEINAVMTRPDNTLEDITAINNNDGTWSLKSKAKMTGKHEIRVSVFKKPVKGSPVTINVIPMKGLICKFGRSGSGVGELNDAWGVRVTKDGKIRVCERGNNRLQTHTLDGQHSYTTTFSNMPSTASPQFSAVSEDGSVFTTDSNSRKIIVHDENGSVIRCFGENVINYPFGIAISPVNGRVYVGDIHCHCIHIYSQDGHHYKSFGCQGQGNGQLNSPVDIAIDAEGNVSVSDQSNHRIQVFDAEGQYLYSFGSQGSGDNQMCYPRGLSLDSDGSVYVCDHGNNRVMKYDSRGKFICRIDSDDSAESPSGICVTDDKPFGKVLVVNLNKCVQVFAQ
ncbi:tripartite motif-containing protein 2-like [Ptychodera flava]|uniref:tripartite motif-containing protein 2-like n=1 Tax=Ptychodera flava TaxID=63121 RepID=UPI00396A38F2